MDAEELFYQVILSAAFLFISGIELFFLGMGIEFLLAITLTQIILVIGLHKRWKNIKENHDKKMKILGALFFIALFISQTSFYLLLEARADPFVYWIFPFSAVVLIIGYYFLNKRSKDWKKDLTEKPEFSAICNELKMEKEGKIKETGGRGAPKVPDMKISKGVELALASDKLLIAELPLFGSPTHSKYERNQIQSVELEELKSDMMLDRNWALKITIDGKTRAFLTNEESARKIKEWWAKQ